MSGLEFAYVTMSGARLAIRLSGEVILGDYGVNAKLCPKTSKYYCVNSDVFKFAVPKKIDDKDQLWEVNGTRYVVIESLRYMIVFGKEIRIMVISTTDRAHNGNTGTMYFYYSPEYGLMGFQAVLKKSPTDSRPNESTIYLLANQKGFGAINQQ